MTDRTARVETVVAAPPFSRISWGAILAGTVCAFAIQLLLNLVGLGIGLSAVDLSDGEGFGAIGVGAGIWWGLSAIVSLILGGWVAGRLAGVPIRITAALHGFSVWALATLLTLWIATSTFSSAVSGAFGAVGQIGQAAAAMVDDSDSEPGQSPRLAEQRDAISAADQRRQSVMRSIRTEARDLYRQVVSRQEQQAAVAAAQDTATDILRTPGDVGQDLNALVDRLFASDGVLSEEDRQQALAELEDRFGISAEDAEAIVDNWQERYQAAVSEVDDAVTQLQDRASEAASEAAEAAADAVGAAAGWTSLALALGLFAALIGGVLGKPEPWMIEAVEDETVT